MVENPDEVNVIAVVLILFAGRKSKVSAWIPPDAMDMAGRISLGVRLSVDEFNQESWTFNPVVVSYSRCQRSSPGELDIFPTGTLNLLQSGGGDVSW